MEDRRHGSVPTAADRSGREPAMSGAVADTVTALPILSSNYVYVVHPSQARAGDPALVVDPGAADSVSRWLEGRGLQLHAILLTHHHQDHIGGVADLLRRWPRARVLAAAADRDRIPLQTRSLRGGESFPLLGRRVEVLWVPGHTRAHIAYHLTAPAPGSPGDLFCGDTLFLGGCGRLFEGTAADLHASLRRLAALPDLTRIWCAHEYTEANYRWAVQERPRDPALRERLSWARDRRQAGAATVPGLLAQERRTNLFLASDSVAELARLRRSKDGWNG
jgi:hydroxyacylglutathione hydrolase